MSLTTERLHRVDQTALIEVPCPACGSGDYRVLYPDTLNGALPVFGYKWIPEVRKAFRIVKCSQCGHGYCSPILADIHKHYQDLIDESYLANKELRRATARKVLRRIARYVPSGRLLDVGCGTGDFLAVASGVYSVEGLELSVKAAEIAKAQGLTIHAKLLSDFVHESPEAFDVTTLWGVIEHLQQPVQEMRHINRLVRAGGIVCLWTGDIDSLPSRLFGRNWWYIIGQHVQYFSRRSLDRLMRHSGFEPVFSGTYPYVMSLGYLGESLSRYPLLRKMVRPMLQTRLLRERCIPLYLPGEIFAIYRKIRTCE